MRECRLLPFCLDGVGLWIKPRRQERTPFHARILLGQLLRIEAAHPRWQSVSVIVARRERAILRVPEHALLRTAEHQNSTSILYRYRQRSAFGIMHAQPVHQCAAAKTE